MINAVFMILYMAIILCVVEFSATIFRLTGLDSTVSRFQVISMLTGTGFTTDESDSIINHPIRRKIGAFLILFGAFSLAVIISNLSAILANDIRLLEISIILIVCIFLLLVVRLAFIKNFLTKKFRHNLEEHYDLCEHPIQDVLFLDQDDTVTDVSIKEGSKLIGKDLCNLIDENNDINLLFVKRGEIKIRKGLSEEKIQEGDQLYVYGNKKDMKSLFCDDWETKEKRIDKNLEKRLES